jgi:hypothetical protein
MQLDQSLYKKGKKPVKGQKGKKNGGNMQAYEQMLTPRHVSLSKVHKYCRMIWRR